MTSSLLAERRVGAQTPRVERVPPFDYSEGPRAIAAAHRTRLRLDAWQQGVIVGGLGVALDGDWTAKKASVWVPRQNGKGGVIEGLELYWLFGSEVVCEGCGFTQAIGLPRCLRCKVEVSISLDAIVSHTAHRHDTAGKAYKRLQSLIRNTPEYHARVRLYRETNGNQRVELKDGRYLEYTTRGNSGGRGDTVPKKVYDEAQELTEDQVADAEPTTSAVKYAQTWYFGTPPKDPTAWCYNLREDGEAGYPDHAHWDWGLAIDLTDAEAKQAALSLDAAYAANPAMGVRIEEATVLREQRPSSLGEAYFAERLGVWPPRMRRGASAISAEAWAKLADPASRRVGDVAFAVDMNPKRTHTAIGLFGRRSDGLGHVELVDYRPGSDWVVGRLKELRDRHNPVGVVLDPLGPAGSLRVPLVEAGFARLDRAEPRRGCLVTVTSEEVAAACGQMLDAVEQGSFRHIDQGPLSLAATHAVLKPMGDRTVLGRRISTVDIAPLYAVTMARFWLLGWREPEVGAPNLW